MDFEALKKDQTAFDAKLDEMMKAHAGEFVVVHSGSIAGFSSTYAAAYRSALKQFGIDETFLVSEVKKRDPEPISISWQAGVMFSHG